MCGISGAVVAQAGVAEEAIAEQIACQRHRGPDAEGFFSGGRGVIAQNRLAVIDLRTGDPPMTDEHGHIGAVLNGEIYNFRELREDLQREGHSFSSTGDTETLAHL